MMPPFQEELIMSVSERISNASRSRDSRIILGYAAFAIMLAVGIWLAAGGPGVPQADIAVATALP
jgi:hypothetical protein